MCYFPGCYAYIIEDYTTFKRNGSILANTIVKEVNP